MLPLAEQTTNRIVAELGKNVRSLLEKRFELLLR